MNWTGRVRVGATVGLVASALVLGAGLVAEPARPAEAAVAATDTPAATVQMGYGAISGRITVPAGKSWKCSGATVIAYRLINGSYRRWDSWATNRKCTFAFDQLKEGTYLLQINYDDSMPTSPSVTGYWAGNGRAIVHKQSQARPIRLTDGTTIKVTPKMRSCATITGRVTSPTKGSFVSLETISGNRLVGRASRVASNGTYRISGVWPGKYYLRYEQVELRGFQSWPTYYPKNTSRMPTKPNFVVKSCGVKKVSFTSQKVIRLVKPPTVSGTAKTGHTLKAKAARFKTKGVTIRYQWLRNGYPISGATKKTYRITEARPFTGTTYSVRVTATKRGYLPRTVTSLSVKLG